MISAVAKRSAASVVVRTAARQKHLLPKAVVASSQQRFSSKYAGLNWKEILKTPGEKALDYLHNADYGGARLKQLRNANPHVNVVRYEHKNQTWTMHHVDHWAEALATGLLDGGLIPGDVILHCMPQHWSETMILQFACSKAGLVLYELDADLAQKSQDAAKLALAAGLKLSKANVLYCPEAHEDVNYVRLAEEVVPEVHFFDKQRGQEFLSPSFPHLRYCVHPGYDDDDTQGWALYRAFLVPAYNLEPEHHTDLKTPLSGKTPLLGTFELNGQGIPTALGKTLTNDQVYEKKIWSTYCKILDKDYHEVAGVGVVF